MIGEKRSFFTIFQLWATCMADKCMHTRTISVW